MKEKAIDFGTGKVSTLFRQLFFPTLLGMISASAVTTIDGIATVNICIPLLMILTGIGLMVGMGSSVIASIFLAHGQRRLARASITQALLLVTVVTLVLVILILLFPERSAYQTIYCLW